MALLAADTTFLIDPVNANLRIVSACDLSYFPGLCLTLSSVLVHLPEALFPRITVIHEGLSRWHERKLTRLLKTHCSDAEIGFYPIALSKIKLPDAPGLHPLAYARLLAPGIVDEARFIYLDSDLLVLRDVSPLIELLDGRCLAVAPICGILGDDCPWLDPSKMRPDDPYFCSGIMVVDKARWQANQITEQSIALADREPEKCKHYDQTVLNFVLHGMVKCVDESWSWNHWRFDNMPDGPVILHYITGGKPWLAPLGYGARGLWLRSFEKLCGDFLPGECLKTKTAAKVNGYARSLQAWAAGALDGSAAGRLLGGKAEEWRWAARKAREERSEATARVMTRALERLDRQVKAVIPSPVSA
jgi:lipopolysaccharide biosynthesis glycosyltransferase